jgi:hypothetical protein
MNYEFKQAWTKEDYVAFATNHMLTSVFKLSNILLFTGSIGYLLLTPIFSGSWTFFYLGIGIFFFLIFFLLFTRYGAKRAYDKHKDSMIINFVLNDEGLTYLTNDGNLLKHWSEFYSIKETEDYFFVYFNKNNGMLLAKRDFGMDINRFIKDNCNKHMVNKRKIKWVKEEEF